MLFIDVQLLGHNWLCLMKGLIWAFCFGFEFGVLFVCIVFVVACYIDFVLIVDFRLLGRDWFLCGVCLFGVLGCLFCM